MGSSGALFSRLFGLKLFKYLLALFYHKVVNQTLDIQQNRKFPFVIHHVYRLLVGLLLTKERIFGAFAGADGMVPSEEFCAY